MKLVSVISSLLIGFTANAELKPKGAIVASQCGYSVATEVVENQVLEACVNYTVGGSMTIISVKKRVGVSVDSSTAYYQQVSREGGIITANSMFTISDGGYLYYGGLATVDEVKFNYDGKNLSGEGFNFKLETMAITK